MLCSTYRYSSVYLSVTFKTIEALSTLIYTKKFLQLFKLENILFYSLPFHEKVFSLQNISIETYAKLGFNFKTIVLCNMSCRKLWIVFVTWRDDSARWRNESAARRNDSAVHPN